MVDARDSLAVNDDAVAREPLAMSCADARAVRAQHNVGTPPAQGERQLGGVGTVADGGETPIPPLPSVAVRAMKDRASIAFVEAGNRRQVVDHTGCEQQEA